MKTVFNNSEICHIFANRTQSEGRTPNNNVFFGKNTIYSYGTHFELAKFIEYNDKTYLFVNTTNYSSSTSKHQNHFRQAINSAYFDGLFKFDFLYGKFDLNSYTINLVIERLLNQAKDNFNAQLKARTNYYLYESGLSLRNNAMSLQNSFFELSDKCNLKFDNLKDLENRAYLKHKDLKDNYITNLNFKQERAELKKLKNLEKWLNGTFNGQLYNLPARLRLFGEDVQTSHGALVPLSHAKFLISLIDKGIDVTGKRIGHYTVNEITLDYIKIGCHVIQFDLNNEFIDKNLR